MESGEDTLDLKGQRREIGGHGRCDGNVEERSPSKTFFADPLVLVCGGEEREVLVRMTLRKVDHGGMNVLTYFESAGAVCYCRLSREPLGRWGHVQSRRDGRLGSAS